MTKENLTLATERCIETTRAALQTLWDSINKGQRKQLRKRQEIKALLDRYGVACDE